MNVILNCLFVGVGGMLGAVGRYLIGLLPVDSQRGFPVTTLAINIIGAFCIGLIAAFSEKSGNMNPQIVLLLKVGVCGGFTTFSTFSHESLRLMQGGRYLAAFAYIALSVMICIAAVAGAEVLISRL